MPLAHPTRSVRRVSGLVHKAFEEVESIPARWLAPRPVFNFLHLTIPTSPGSLKAPTSLRSRTSDRLQRNRPGRITLRHRGMGLDAAFDNARHCAWRRHKLPDAPSSRSNPPAIAGFSGHIYSCRGKSTLLCQRGLGLNSLPSANDVEAIKPRRGSGEQVSFFRAAGTLCQQLAGIPEDRITV